ncbi:unnamed protein product [Rhizophagus irregularis]|nr:unnamed protein product [Rhizophagus irregularis]
MRYLFDGGIDSRFSFTSNALVNLLHHLKRLLDDWFIIEKPEENTSKADRISNVYLKKHIPRRKAEENLPNNFTFRRELASAYRDMGYESTFFESPCQHYELACSLDDDGVNMQYHLHVGDAVAIISKEEGGKFAIVRSIFSHKRNNQHFAFIAINMLEITNLTKLGCPVYRLQDTRQICSLSVVDTNCDVHFVHYCNDNECNNGEHDFGNNLYIRNMYFFKAL